MLSAAMALALARALAALDFARAVAPACGGRRRSCSGFFSLFFLSLTRFIFCLFTLYLLIYHVLFL